MSSERSSSLELHSALSSSASSLQLPSVPPTPTPTPNPALSVTHHFGPEQLAASINNIKADAGYDDGSSVPATPTPTPFSPSPAQIANNVRPDQVMQGLERLQEQQHRVSHSSSMIGSEQPPTPTATPRQQPPPPMPAEAVVQDAGLPAVAVAEVLAAGIGHLRKSDEGLESSSDPATPVATPAATPISPATSHFMPEQLAAGIDRLRAEAHDGLSSGGSSGFPSTPAPTPFNAKVDGVRPEELAAGISRLSVIEETDNKQPELSTYFGGTEDSESKSFFDHISPNGSNDPLMHSCRESRLDLPLMATENQETLEQESSKDRLPSKETTQPGMPFSSDKSSPLLSSSSVSYSSHPKTSSTVAEPLMTSIKAKVALTTPKPIMSPLPSAQNDDSLVIEDNFNDHDSVDDEAFEAHNDPIYCFWIPDNATTSILSSMSNSRSDSNNYYVDRANLTRPTLMLHEDLVDPVLSLVAHFRGESETQKRVVLNADAVSQDTAGLRRLIRAQCYRAAVNLTGRLLRKNGHHPSNEHYEENKAIVTHSPLTMQLWFARLALLVRLRQFSMAESESEAFGDLDRPDLYFAFYPDQSSDSGCMVPFGMRILIAEIPQHLGKYAEAIDRLYALKDQVMKIRRQIDTVMELEDEEMALRAKDLWKRREIRVIQAIINCCISQKDYELAVLHINSLLTTELSPSSAQMASVHSALGRCLLQLGDLSAASIHFDHASSMRNSESAPSLLDAALMSMANQEYDEALRSLNRCDELLPNCPLIVNNIAVCLLYMGRLKESIGFLETRVGKSPSVYLQENVVLNLCTLYELESSYASQKKSALLDLVSLHCGDGFNTAVLKMQT